jgi:hypothetical protein
MAVNYCSICFITLAQEAGKASQKNGFSRKMDSTNLQFDKVGHHQNNEECHAVEGEQTCSCFRAHFESANFLFVSRKVTINIISFRF